jgi:Zn-dependent peptidase ImmA (M78 family)
MHMRRARSADDIRKEASQLLRKHRIKKPPVPVDKIAESLGATVRYSPFEGELAGMLVRANGQIIIGVNSLHHINRQRFTIAHECGHFLLHQGEEIHIDRTFRINKRNEVSSMAVDADEIEANRFAAELLMPFDMIMADLHEREIDVENEQELKELAQRYQVSVQSLTHRITNLIDYL